MPLLYHKGLEKPLNEENQLITILGLTLQGFEDGMRESEKARRDRILGRLDSRTIIRGE